VLSLFCFVAWSREVDLVGLAAAYTLRTHAAGAGVDRLRLVRTTNKECEVEERRLLFATVQPDSPA